ncbi:transcription factor grauzone-like isoform X2 [Musca autumnalis]|uniref:transcription factor grauzone-like isoform X2 n=2 Tax=Musca autumnalis TaxID=221902 RepID=UPI003CFA9DDF
MYTERVFVQRETFICILSYLWKMQCYVCLLGNKETLPIFGKDVLDFNIADMIEKHLSFKPDSMDNSEICVDCWNKLSDFHDFYQNVTAAHEQLESLEIKMQGDLSDDESLNIKEEHFEGSTQNSNDYYNETDDVHADDPFINITTEDNNETDNNGTKTKEKAKHEDPSFESDDSEDSKPLAKLSTDLKSDASKSEKKKRPYRKKSKKVPTKRKSYIMLEENNELIKKHIHMLCQICQYIGEDFPSLNNHYKEKHTGTKAHIICCDRKLDCPSDILQHAYYHEDPNYFKCNECDKTYMNKTALKDHYRRHHEEESNLPYQCDQCPRKFARKHLLEHHRAKHVPIEERSHYCEICKPKRAFANEYILNLHIKNRHYKATNICHICAKKIHDKQAFEKHVRSHSESSGPRLKCPLEGCESWLKDKDNLRQHLRRFHDNTPHKCPECGRMCKNKHSLTCHIKATHSTQVYTCEECQKSFKSQQSLKEHLAVHTGEPLYGCLFCCRKFNSKANMYAHKKKIHPKEWEKWKQSKIIGSKQNAS